MFNIQFPTKRVFWIFRYLENNKIMLFCDLFIEQPSYVLFLISYVFHKRTDLTVHVLTVTKVKIAQ